MKNFWGFEGVVEKLAVKHYSQNIKKGKEIIEHYINILKNEGITHVARFEDKLATPLPPIKISETEYNSSSEICKRNSVDFST